METHVFYFLNGTCFWCHLAWDTNLDSFVLNMVGSSQHSLQNSEFDSTTLWLKWNSCSIPGQSKNLSSRSLPVALFCWQIMCQYLKGVIQMTRKAEWNFRISHPLTPIYGHIQDNLPALNLTSVGLLARTGISMTAGLVSRSKRN